VPPARARRLHQRLRDRRRHLLPAAGRFPRAIAASTTSPTSSTSSSPRLDSANGNACTPSPALRPPVDLLVGVDGALYVLTRGGITRISAA
jgi:hypothetical protein